MDGINFRICDEHSYGEKAVKVFGTEYMSQEAQMAITLLEKWGMVAAVPEGEDSAGRTTLRLMDPGEIVSRAFDIARLAMREARSRGLVLTVPDLNEINAERDAAAGAKAKREKVDA